MSKYEVYGDTGRNEYEVIVGNIGSVYSGTGWNEAKRIYGGKPFYVLI